jgi:NTP pyrophosphatase (non-canonical NTP hydrolase)
MDEHEGDIAKTAQEGCEATTMGWKCYRRAVGTYKVLGSASVVAPVEVGTRLCRRHLQWASDRQLLIERISGETRPRGSGDFSIGSQYWPGISKLIEECGEVVQVGGKLLGSRGEVEHWDGSNLRGRLEDEIGDVLAACSFVVQNNGLNEERISGRHHEKLKLFCLWHQEQDQQ